MWFCVFLTKYVIYPPKFESKPDYFQNCWDSMQVPCKFLSALTNSIHHCFTTFLSDYNIILELLILSLATTTSDAALR